MAVSTGGVGRPDRYVRLPPWNPIQERNSGVLVRDGQHSRHLIWKDAMDRRQLRSVEDEPGDEELMRRLAAGQEEALVLLHARYAGLIFTVASQSLDRSAAEEIVQDVFVAVWRKARTYDPSRGEVRPWLMRIARTRAINELRRRGRRPATVDDPEQLQLTTVPAGEPGPDEATWREYRRSAVQDAVDALPPAQRQALSLAFFEELSHQQIAAFLGLPLGTTKTRIRAGVQRLRVALVPLVVVVAVALVAGLVAFGLRERDQLDRFDAALRMVTSSDATALRLVAAQGTNSQTHGLYRTRPGATQAVVTLSHLAPAPKGQSYQLFARSNGTWWSLGTARPDRDGHALLIVDQDGNNPPEALELTLEQGGGSAAPGGRIVIAWPDP
jgi:RNA polymerase sigma-70 factor (ECF subfamily)